MRQQLGFPPIEYVRDERESRGWSIDDLLDRMPGNRQVNEVALAIMALEDPRIHLGRETAIALGLAFDTSSELWLGLDDAFRTAKTKAR
jgi:plasmid maintenance system antidote protein VapI